MKQLMIHVERAVRPVRGEDSTKCRMREELYDHISEIYQEELERGSDEDTAIRRACERFGEPATLRAELQATVPWGERIVYPLNEIVRRRPDETLLRCAIRLAATNLFCGTALCGMVLLASLMFGMMGVGPTAHGMSVNFGLGFRLVAALVVWESVGIVPFVLISPAMCSQLEAGLLRPRSWWAAGVLSVLAAAIVLGCGSGFLLTMPIDGTAVSQLLPRWILMALVTPLMFVALSRLAAIDAVRSRPWTSLDISD